MREDAHIRIRFAGGGDTSGSGGRWQTCIHLSGAGQVVLVDCGATSLVALKAQGLDPTAVDAVAVTHLHAQVHSAAGGRAAGHPGAAGRGDGSVVPGSAQAPLMPT